MSHKLAITGVLMAGGGSRRMGRDKTFLEIGGRPLIERTVKVLEGICQEVLISSNNPDQHSKYGQVIPDVIEGKGPLGGLHAVLPQSKYEVVFMTACDMPFIDPEGIQLLYNELGDYDILVPYAASIIHPLHAFYRKKIIPLVEQHLLLDRLRLVELFAQCRTKILNVEEEIQDQKGHKMSGHYFVNTNTPEEWAAILEMINEPEEAVKN